MYVVTADQRGSRSAPDAVPDLIAALAGQSSHRGLVRPFERTAGDEVQALYASAPAVVDAVVELVRQGQWWVGVGVGPVETPLPKTARAGRGSAYVAARRAIEAAKSSPSGVCVRCDDAVAGPDGIEATVQAETAVWLLAALLSRRTPEGWEVVDLMAPNARQLDIAAKLGVSPQAVSRRLRVAGWQEQQRGEQLTAWLLEHADA